jgi:hypothetical protein
MKPQDHKLGTFAPPRPDFQTGGFTPLSRRRSQAEFGLQKILLEKTKNLLRKPRIEILFAPVLQKTVMIVG